MLKHNQNKRHQRYKRIYRKITTKIESNLPKNKIRTTKLKNNNNSLEKKLQQKNTKK